MCIRDRYKGEIVWYSIYINAEDSSLGQKESDEIIDAFTIENNKKEIHVTEYQIKGYEEMCIRDSVGRRGNF